MYHVEFQICTLKTTKLRKKFKMVEITGSIPNDTD